MRKIYVLNAFRHHGERDDGCSSVDSSSSGCSTPSGITASGTGASRHADAGPAGAQRLPASRRAGPAEGESQVPDAWCSTHSGITASGTAPVPASSSTESRVLNAFRHHGERDPVHGGVSPPRSCSTPSGITASGTRDTRLVKAGQLDGAQRLPASRRAGQEEGGGGSGTEYVCSTPSGITASGTQAGCPRAAEAGGAQRLPASRQA